MTDDLTVLQRDAEFHAHRARKWFCWVALAAIGLAVFDIGASLAWIVALVVTAYNDRIAQFIQGCLRSQIWTLTPGVRSAWHCAVAAWLRRVWRMHLFCHPSWRTHDALPLLTLVGTPLALVIGAYPAFMFQSVIALAWLATTDVREKTLMTTVLVGGWYIFDAALARISGVAVPCAISALLSLLAVLLAATMVTVFSRRVIRLVTAAFGYDARVRGGLHLFRARRVQNPNTVRQRIKHIGLALLFALSLAVSWQAGLVFVLAVLAVIGREQIMDACENFWTEYHEAYWRREFLGE